MVDEVAEVKQYIDGKHLEDQRNYYRACYMISKYYKKLGYSKEQTLAEVIKWQNNNSLSFDFSPISCISAAYDSGVELRNGTTVWISTRDRENIMSHTDCRNDRKVALALLCCSKAYANADGVFTASVSALANWTGIDRCNIHTRQIKRLIDFGYIEKLPQEDSLNGWRKDIKKTACRFKILVQYDTNGVWKLRDNNLDLLYEQMFAESSRQTK